MRSKGLLGSAIRLLVVTLFVSVSLASASTAEFAAAGVGAQQHETVLPVAEGKSVRPEAFAGSVAAGCTWDACTGKSPVSMGCTADGKVLGSSGTLALYYSPSCRAAWGVVSYGCNGACSLTIWFTEPFGFAERYFAVPVSATKDYMTPLVTWNDSVKTCAAETSADAPADPDPDGLGVPTTFGECTRWF